MIRTGVTMSEKHTQSTTLISGKEFELERQQTEHLLEKAKRKKKLAKIAVGVLSLLLVISIGLFIHNNNEMKKTEIKQEQLKAKKLEDQRKAEAKKKTASTFALTKEEYQSNIDILSSANIGLHKNENGRLIGKIRMSDGSVKTLVDYTRKDGMFHCLDEKNQPILYSKKWVQAFVEKVKIVTANKKTVQESTSSTSQSSSEKGKE